MKKKYFSDTDTELLEFSEKHAKEQATIKEFSYLEIEKEIA